MRTLMDVLNMHLILNSEGGKSTSYSDSECEESGGKLYTLDVLNVFFIMMLVS